MEKIMDFDEWFANYKPEPVKYVAVFDPETGRVTSIGPSHAFENSQFKIDIDANVAQLIIDAEIKIHHCFVDTESGTLEITEVKNMFKIDDVLHRVISKEFFTGKKIDLCLSHNKQDNSITIELSEEFGGTRKSEVAVKNRGFVWEGDTELLFLVTEYNDPNLLLDTFSVTINELIGQSKIIESFNHHNFSIYTRRLFKNYVIETK